MYKILCKDCNQEMVATDSRGQSCKCPNGAYIRLDREGQPVIMAEDLERVELITSVMKPKSKVKNDFVETPKRRIRRLDFEVR